MSLEEKKGGRVTRRRVLQVLSGTGIVALAGCSSGARSGSDEAATQSTGKPTTTARASPTARQTPTAGTTPTESPGGTPAERSDETPTESVDVAALEKKVSDLSFEGKLFDTHAHWAGAGDKGHSRLGPGAFAKRMAGNDVGACVLFTSTVDVAQRYPEVLQQLVTSDVEYLPFLQPMNYRHLVEGEVTSLYEDHRTAFTGIGEIIFYGGPMRGTSLTADPWPELFAFAASEDIPLMIHPTKAQAEGLKTMLSRYPEATVMAHGGEFNLAPGKLVPILRNNENLYWTVDAGSMLNGLVLTASDASAFVSRYDQREKEFKRLVGQILPPLMDAAPNRVMWGTDIATSWNTDPQVYSRVMDWTRAAIESLPDDQQDKYAYENAKQLFGI